MQNAWCAPRNSRLATIAGSRPSLPVLLPPLPRMLLLLLSFACAARASSTTIELDSTPWDFEVDPQNVGVAERWFSDTAKPTLERTIVSPGAWQAQGVGNETQLMYHQYEGVGWYRKTLSVNVPAAGESLWLWIGGAPGGVMRSANVWANSVHCGRHVGYLEPLEIEVTKSLASSTGSKLVIAVAVDSRWNRTEDPLWGGGSMWNSGGTDSGGGAGAHIPLPDASGGDGYSFGGYGGIIGHAKLLVRQRAWFEDSVHVGCKHVDGTAWSCTVEFALRGQVKSSDRVSLNLCEYEDGDSTNCEPAVVAEVNGNDRTAVTVPVPRAKLWIPGTRSARTNMYVANLSLSGENVDTARSTRFGVKSVSVNTSRILFNGEPLFLRGYGDDAQYGFTGAPPMKKQYYMDQLAGMKALGYNFIRFHTHSMPDVFHEAADELGMLCDPEFSMNYKYPCPFPGCVLNEQVKDVFNRSFASIVRRTSHHPSLFGYVLSNEIGFGTSAQFAELYRFANTHDPERPCWFSDGATSVGLNVSTLACRNGENSEDQGCFMDIWVPQSSWSHTAVKGDMGSGVSAADLPVPMLLHEAMDARTFPRLEAKLQAFEGGLFKAHVWLNSSIDRMRALGLLSEHSQWALASEQVYNMFMKAYLESYRLDVAVSGYEWWLGFDWLAANNGIIGGHANYPQAKPGISNETLAQLQNEVILLIKEPVALQSTGRRPGDHVPIEIQLSNWTFMGQPCWFGSVQIEWTTSIVGGTKLQNGSSQIDGLSIEPGSIGPIAAFRVDVPHVVDASKITIEAAVKVSGVAVTSNAWNLTVFPEITAAQCEVSVFVSADDPELLAAAQGVCSNAVVEPSSLSSQTKPFVLLRHSGLSEHDVDALARTGSFGVALNPAAGSFPVCAKSSVGTVAVSPVAFALPWWMAGGTTGTLVYNTSLSYSLGFGQQDNFMDYSWMSTINGGTGYELDLKDSSIVHIRAIPADGVYGSGFGTTVANIALVWESQTPSIGAQGSSTTVTSGRYLVSGLNLFAGLKLNSEPVAEFAFARLLSYAVAEAREPLPSASSQLVFGSAAGTLAAPTCSAPGSVCKFDQQIPCQLKSVSPNTCNQGYEIVTSACVKDDVLLDSLYVHIQAKTPGTKAVGVVYDTSPPTTNKSFCSADVDVSKPRRLVSNGTLTALESSNAVWLRLPMPPTRLAAGVYWVGVMLDADATCFGEDPPNAAPNPALGPGSRDQYALRDFADGPAMGPELDWVHGEQSFAMYMAVRNDTSM